MQYMKTEDLILGLKNGDQKAYNFLFLEYYEWLCNYIYKITNDYGLAEDIVQEVMIILWKKRTILSINSSIKNYLFKACRNQLLQHVRKQKIKLDFIDKQNMEVIDNIYAEDEVVPHENLEKLHVLIDTLPPKCKTVLVKSKLEKMKYKEISEELNISVKTVENHMSKALKLLRQGAINIFLFF